MSQFINIWIKFFFLFTPFSALSIYLTLTGTQAVKHRARVAIQTSVAVGVICLLLFFFGTHIFKVLGLTLDAFRVGAGALLFLSAVQLMQNKQDVDAGEGDIAVVPLAMPIIVGPATVGTLLVMGAETSGSETIVGCLALLAAVLSLGVLLLAGTQVERVLGRRGLNILSKVSGLILAAMGAQMILTGLRSTLQ